MKRFATFLSRKNITISLRKYGVDALGAMAQGLFASLLIGTILSTIGEQLNIPVLIEIGNFAKSMAGPAMAVSIGYALQATSLVLFSLLAVGAASNSLGGAGGPLAVYFITIFATEFGKAVSKETKIDIIVTPLVTIAVGIGLAYWWAPAIGSAASWIGNLIMWSTGKQPFIMGVLVSVIVGMALTLPISSAAICAALSLTGLAGGAALAGCCAQMVGFAVASYRENKWGGVVSQGLGTSMLQIGNIARKPIVWLAPTLAAAILGPISTCILGMTNNAAGAGMGTSGLVGPIGCWATMSATTDHTLLLAEIVGMYFVAPAILSLIIHFAMKRAGWVKEGDLKLQR